MAAGLMGGGLCTTLRLIGEVLTPAASGLTMSGDALTAEGLTITAPGLTLAWVGVEPVRGTMTGLDTTIGPGMTIAGLDMPGVLKAASLGLGGVGAGGGDAPGDVQVILMLCGHFSWKPSPAHAQSQAEMFLLIGSIVSARCHH